MTGIKNPYKNPCFLSFSNNGLGVAKLLDTLVSFGLECAQVDNQRHLNR